MSHVAPTRLTRRVNAFRMGCSVLAMVAALALSAGSARAAGTVLDAGLRFGPLEESGFCVNGVHSEIGALDDPLAPAGVRVFGSYCRQGEAGIGKIASDVFAAPAQLTLFIGGYATQPGLGLALEDPGSGARLLLTPFPSPNRSWRHYTFSLPAQWRDRQVRLTAWDQSAQDQGWFAFSEPVRLGGAVWMNYLSEALLLFLLTILETAVLMLPLVAGCILALRRGVRGESGLAIAFLLLLGVLGYGLFWIYLASPPAGVGASLALILGGGVFLWRWRRGAGYASERRALAPLVPLLAICFLVTVVVVHFGFQFGGVARPQDAPGLRFSHLMPGDNNIPKQFADGLYHGHVDRPLHGGYLSSDRPPLQAGIFLIERPLVGGTVNLTYEVFAVFLQTLWLVGLWIWLSAARIPVRLSVLILATCLCWGFTLLNTFFVWPKLFPSTYLFVICAYLLTDWYGEIRNSPVAGALVGLAAALAMLSHGISVFGIAGIGLAMLCRGRLPGARFLMACVATALVTYAPWMGYQAFIDPPGNALIKQHIAGLDPYDPRSPLRGILDAYAALPIRTLIDNKLANLGSIIGSPLEYARALGSLVAELGRLDIPAASQTATRLRAMEFFAIGPALGIFAAGPLLLAWAAVLRRNRPAELATAWTAWLCVLLTIAFWSVAMFGPGTTIVVTGPYALPILAAAGSILAAWAISPRLAVILCVLQALLQIAIYVALIPGTATDTAIGTAFNPFSAGIAALAAAVLLWTLWRRSKSGAPPPHPPLA